MPKGSYKSFKNTASFSKRPNSNLYTQITFLILIYLIYYDISRNLVASKPLKKAVINSKLRVLTTRNFTQSIDNKINPIMGHKLFAEQQKYKILFGLENH